MQPLKVVAIGFVKNAANPSHPVHPLLNGFEPLYAYGVLSQLARFIECHYRDFATTAERLQLEPGLKEVDAMQQRRAICRTTRCNYLLDGSMALLPTGLRIHLRLFDFGNDRLVLDKAVHIACQTPPMIGKQEIPADLLNTAISQSISEIHMACFQKPLPVRQAAAPFSGSVEAMRTVLAAHHAGELSRKIPLYEQAIKLDPALETAYYHLARIYRLEENYEKSIYHYRKTLEVSQGNARNKASYATEAGICCALINRPELAQQWWQKAIEYDPAFINPYFNLANLYEDQNEFALAEEYFVKAQRLAPDDYRTFFNLARLYSKMGVWDKAVAQYERQIESEGGDPWCHSDIATCYLNLGKADKAREHLEKTVALDNEGEAAEYAKLILGGLG